MTVIPEPEVFKSPEFLFNEYMSFLGKMGTGVAQPIMLLKNDLGYDLSGKSANMQITRSYCEKCWLDGHAGYLTCCNHPHTNDIPPRWI